MQDLGAVVPLGLFWFKSATRAGPFLQPALSAATAAELSCKAFKHLLVDVLLSHIDLSCTWLAEHLCSSVLQIIISLHCMQGAKGLCFM